MNRLIYSFGIVYLLILTGCTRFDEDFVEKELDESVDNSECI